MAHEQRALQGDRKTIGWRAGETRHRLARQEGKVWSLCMDIGGVLNEGQNIIFTATDTSTHTHIHEPTCIHIHIHSIFL